VAVGGAVGLGVGRAGRVAAPAGAAGVAVGAASRVLAAEAGAAGVSEARNPGVGTVAGRVTAGGGTVAARPGRPPQAASTAHIKARSQRHQRSGSPLAENSDIAA
jgi:hypothetical protein